MRGTLDVDAHAPLPTPEAARRLSPATVGYLLGYRLGFKEAARLASSNVGLSPEDAVDRSPQGEASQRAVPPAGTTSQGGA